MSGAATASVLSFSELISNSVPLLGLFAVCATGGLLAGLYLYHSEPPEGRKRHDIFGAIVVSLVVPLILSIVEADLLDTFLSSDGSRTRAIALVFGVSIVFSLYSRFFLYRLIQYMDRATAKFMGQEEDFDQFKRRFASVASDVEGIQEIMRATTEEESASGEAGEDGSVGKVRETLAALNEDERRVIQDFLNSTVDIRSLTGLSASLGIAKAELLPILEGLVEKELVRAVSLKSDENRWTVRPLVVSVFGRTNIAF